MGSSASLGLVIVDKEHVIALENNNNNTAQNQSMCTIHSPMEGDPAAQHLLAAHPDPPKAHQKVMRRAHQALRGERIHRRHSARAAVVVHADADKELFERHVYHVALVAGLNYRTGRIVIIIKFARFFFYSACFCCCASSNALCG